MSDVVVTVLPNPFAWGWPRHERGWCVDVLPLARALSNTYNTDAHFAAYATSKRRRLTREALDQGTPIELSVIAFDFDCPSVHGTSEPAPDAWRADFLAQVAELAAAHPNPFVYQTRGGARVVYRQAEPTVLRSQDDAQRWSQGYAVCVAHLKRCFGLLADPSCADWQRLYRLPHATRDRGGKPENRPTCGDAARVGTLMLEATHEDVSAARVASKAFRERRVTSFTPCTSDGAGLLYHLLRARGCIIRPHLVGAHVIRCPRESHHSSGFTGDGSTFLYGPASGNCIGAIHCMHAHCAHMSVPDWLRMFSEQELDAARRAAGIARSA